MSPMAMMKGALASPADAAGVCTTELPPGYIGISKDAFDALTLLLVFAFGWLLFNPRSPLGGLLARSVRGRPVGSRAKTAKAACCADDDGDFAACPSLSAPPSPQKAVSQNRPRDPAPGWAAAATRGGTMAPLAPAATDAPATGAAPRLPLLPRDDTAESDVSDEEYACFGSAPSCCSTAASGSEAWLDGGLSRKFSWLEAPLEDDACEFAAEMTSGSACNRVNADLEANDADKQTSPSACRYGSANNAEGDSFFSQLSSGMQEDDACVWAAPGTADDAEESPQSALFDDITVVPRLPWLDMDVGAGEDGDPMSPAFSWFVGAAEDEDCDIVSGWTRSIPELARAYGRSRRADLAVDLFFEHFGTAEDDFADEDEKLELLGAVYEACASCRDWAAAERLARHTDFLAPRTHAGQAAMLALARRLARRQDLDAAVRCIEAVEAAEGAVDPATLRSLLLASAKSRDLSQAQAYFRRLGARGVHPDRAVFSALVRGFCSAGRIEQAMEHFHLMRQRGIAPDAALFDAMLAAGASRNMPTLVAQVLKDMEAAGVGPSDTTMEVLCRFYGRRGDLDAALAACQEARDRHSVGLGPAASGALVAACLENGRLDLALEEFRRLAASGRRSSARTYEALIASCLRNGDLDGAVGLVDDALSLTAPAAGGQVAPVVARTGLGPAVVEEVLQLAGKRGQAARLAGPLFERLRRAGYHVSEAIAEAVATSLRAPSQRSGPSAWQQRRSAFENWQSAAP